eukprot:8536399-Alexandrium_andersonii.AAC.1
MHLSLPTPSGPRQHRLQAHCQPKLEERPPLASPRTRCIRAWQHMKGWGARVFLTAARHCCACPRA